MADAVESGTCISCGRPLVRVVGERTYHPHDAVDPDDKCPMLLPIEGTSYTSHDVPDSAFVPGPTIWGHTVQISVSQFEAMPPELLKQSIGMAIENARHGATARGHGTPELKIMFLAEYIFPDTSVD